MAVLWPLILVAGEGDSTADRLDSSLHSGFLGKIASYLPLSLLNSFPVSILLLSPTPAYHSMQ